MSAQHTPGPWHLVERNNEIRIYPDWDGRPGGVALSIGSVALSFRPRRQGSHRGEKMVYRPFSEQDRADARLIAAAPDMLQALREVAGAVDEAVNCPFCLVRHGRKHARDCTMHFVLDAIAKAEGRS